MRSLASETVRQALRQTSRGWQLQWYTADFREERSALDGSILVSMHSPMRPSSQSKQPLMGRTQICLMPACTSARLLPQLDAPLSLPEAGGRA